MEKEDRKKVNWFKGELRSYYNNKPAVIQLRQKVILLNAKFSKHSPSLTGIHYYTAPHDSKLAHYIDEKSYYERDLQAMETQAQRVENILSNMSVKMQNIIQSVYSGKCNMAAVAYDEHYTERQMKNIVDHAILDAINKYYE